MNISRALSFVAAAVIAIGLAGPAMADDFQEFEFEILEGDEFSVEILQASNFGDAEFTLGVQNSATVQSASFDFTVTDLRGSGAGWYVRISSTGFVNADNNDPIEGAQLHSTNNTPWATNIPANSAGFSPAAGAVVTGVDATLGWSNVLGAGHVRIWAEPGITNDKPNGTGEFSVEEALYLTFPEAIAAGTYTATVVLTLTSGEQP